MSAVGGWARRNRRRLLLGGAVAGGLAVVGKMLHQHVRRAQEQETKELLEKARRQHHFDTTEQTCSQTLRNLFPSLRQAVSENLDSTPLTDMLRAKPPQEEKLQLWEKLKVLAFTRCSVLVVSGVYIAIMLRTQLNILAGYLYQQQVDHGGEPVATDNNNTGDKHKTFTIKLQQTYLDVCTHFVSSGIKLLCSHVTDVVTTVTANMELQQKMSLADIEAVLTEIFNQLEMAGNDRNVFRNPGAYFIPEEDSFDPDTSNMSSQEKEILKKMLAETLDVIDSEDAISLAILVSRQGVSHMVDRVADYYATIGMSVDQSQPGSSDKSSLHDSGFVSPANVSLAVAKLIPILSGLINPPDNAVMGMPDGDLWLVHLQQQSGVKLLGANVYETFSQDGGGDEVTVEEESWINYVSRSMSSFF